MGSLSQLSPSLYTSDCTRQIRFYTDRLGFSCEGTWSEEDSEENSEENTVVWCRLVRDGHSLMFSVAPEAEREELKSPHLSGLLYLEVDDLDAELARLGDVALEWGPETMPYGMREAAFADPEGYRIVLAQPVRRVGPSGPG